MDVNVRHFAKNREYSVEFRFHGSVLIDTFMNVVINKELLC